MSKYIVRYFEVKERKFNKMKNLLGFIHTSTHKVIEVYEKKDGYWELIRDADNWIQRGKR